MRPAKQFSVYIMTNVQRSHVLYTGVTGNLVRRVWQHKSKSHPGFTSRYNLNQLVYNILSILMPRSPAKKKSKGGGAARK